MKEKKLIPHKQVGEIESYTQSNGICRAKCSCIDKHGKVQSMSIGGKTEDDAIYELKKFCGWLKDEEI